ncbi:hypothetical protein ACSBR1_019371 [Camellia fascicularis]
MITFLFFLVLLFFYANATPLSFNLSTIQHNDSLINCTGDASISSQGIQVTRDTDMYNASSLQWRTGRATCTQLMHLWDAATGNLTDFSTNFSFIIRGNNYGEGLAFFLAPNGSNIPPNSTGGGLGLINENQTTASTGVNRFVAVEFDTYKNNPWQEGLPINHVGINVNSRSSAVVSSDWQSGITNGKTNEARIKYDSSTQNLSVSFFGFPNDNQVTQGLFFIVDLRQYLPEWVTFGFSASTGDSYEKNTIKSWEFTASFQSDERVEEVAKRKNKIGLVVGLSAGLGAVVGGIALVWFVLCRKGRGRKKDEPVHVRSMDDEFKEGTGPRKFSYNELALATNNFAEEEKLGEGGFGGVYKGFLKELNSFVAVKRVSRESKQGQKEYASEVKIISQLRHRNLVRLTGWCHEKNELLLVYELMPNGSLDSHLFKAKSLLTWEVRYKIAQGLASALFYLHEEWEQCVVHRDIKSSNVMLDSNFNAKLGDFGLARLVDREQGFQTTVVAGTMGYLAPECLVTFKASKESDVYSFGVVALEIACGRRPIEPQDEQSQVKMVEWVWELYGTGKLLEAADLKLCAEFDEQQMERLMIVGLWCAHPDYVLRPSIRQAILVLNFEASLPILPAKMPVPTSYAPPTFSPTSSIGSSFYGTGDRSNQAQSSSYSDNNNNSSKLPASSAASSNVSLTHTK